MSWSDVFIPAGYAIIPAALANCGVGWISLREKLASGTLPGYLLIPDSGKIIQLKPEAWIAVGADSTGRDGRLSVSYLDEYGFGLVRTQELDNVLAGRRARPDAPETNLAQATGARSAVNKGGAPPKFDGEALLIEAFKLLYEDGLRPETQTDLRKLALEKYAQGRPEQEIPSDEWAKPKIRALWNELKLGKNG